MCVEDGEEVSEGRHRKWERAELQARRSLGRLFGAAFKNNFFSRWKMEFPSAPYFFLTIQGRVQILYWKIEYRTYNI
jgi:hypothetical protein